MNGVASLIVALAVLGFMCLAVGGLLYEKKGKYMKINGRFYKVVK